MLTHERHNFIRKELALKGRVLAGDLAARFSVSEDTARRDLRELAKAGDCRRVYGGAMASTTNSGPIDVRVERRSNEKKRIAAAAMKLMRPGQTVFIDSGLTNIAIAHAIPHDFELNVATNSLGVVMALADHSSVTLIVLGGFFDRELGTCVGEETLRAISLLNADLLFLGSCGVDAIRGVTAFNSAEAEVKRAMAKNSASIVVATTADKLATAAPFRVAGPEAIRHLVVDRSVQPALLSKFKKQGTLIHRA